MNDAIKMQISAFVDGELPQNETELLLRRLCQDGELRQQAAEYMAVGRVMRGERTVAGMAQLRQRIAAGLDDENIQQDMSAVPEAPSRLVKPLAGFAIAASVALVALLGLQQMSDTQDVVDSVVPATVAEDDSRSYVTPNPLEAYYNSHTETASYFGADSINARLVDYAAREDLILNAESAAETVVEDDESDAEATAP